MKSNCGKTSKGNPNNGGSNSNSNRLLSPLNNNNNSKMKMKKNRNRLQAFDNAKTKTYGYNPTLISGKTGSSSSSQSCAQSRPTERLYTQAEVDAILASHCSQLVKKIRAADKKTQAIYEALLRAGISVTLPCPSPSQCRDEEPRDDDRDD